MSFVCRVYIVDGSLFFFDFTKFEEIENVTVTLGIGI
jgi:hypothetical protein